ncbi:hypothetical protein BkAM31D_07690 [Halalkalibacter krulwichiae]|uniref:Uncharacterized protein n=1 Tax=Halalkalibacter krulwichiae TaxID=199441 RepID=A0A1X9MH34_9BACI|nr:hypothetical protein BkAM31D_07690 [Halalkalibacter krulwichiae]
MQNKSKEAFLKVKRDLLRRPLFFVSVMLKGKWEKKDQRRDFN